MVANPNTLYLQEIPKSHPHKVVQFVPHQDDNISQQDLALLLAAMTQSLLTDVSKVVQLLSTQQEANATASQDNVSLASYREQQAAQAEQAYQSQLNAQKNPPWWQTLLNIVVKYVLPLVMCVVAALVFGPAAGVVALVVLAATTIPIKDGKSLVGLASAAIAKGLSEDFGWSAGVTELVEGIVNVVMATVLAVVGGGVSSAFAIGEAAETAVSEAVEDGASSAESSVADDAGGGSNFRMNAAKTIGLTTFASVTGGTNAWYDIAYGAFQIVDTDSKDQEKGKEIATWINIIMNVVISLVSLKVSFSSITENIPGAAGSSTIMKLLGSQNVLTIQKCLSSFSLVAMGSQAGSTTNQGFQEKHLKELEATVTEAMADLKFIEGVDQIASQNSNSVNSTLKTTLEHYKTMLSNPVNYASVEFEAAKEMQQCNKA